MFCLGTLGLWVDSYRCWREAGYQGSNYQTVIISYWGGIEIDAVRCPRVGPPRWNYQRLPSAGISPMNRLDFGHAWMVHPTVGCSSHAVAVPHWLPALPSLILPAIWAVKRWRRRIPPGHCKTCGYDLRASEERCPECGTAIPAATDRPTATPTE